jgi:hypothetical protein
MRMAAFWPNRSPTGEVVKVGFGSKAGISPSAVRCAVFGGPSPPTNDSLNRPRASLTSC